MVERVVEQRRELQPEMALLHDILVEREVHDPRARPFQAALLGVAEFSWRRERIRCLIEEGIARPTAVRIPNLIGTPRAAEGVAQAVERFPGVPWARRIKAAEKRGEVLAAARLNDR